MSFKLRDPARPTPLEIQALLEANERGNEKVFRQAQSEADRLAELQAKAPLTPGEMVELKYLVDRKWNREGAA